MLVKISRKNYAKFPDTIHGIKNIVINAQNFKNLLRHCPNKGNVTEQFYGNNMRDAGEFLVYLLNMFPVIEAAKKLTINYGTNNLVTTSDLVETSRVEDDKASIVIPISSFDLKDTANGTKISDFLTIQQDSGELDTPFLATSGPGKGKEFIRKIESTTMIESPAVIFSLNRNDPISEEVLDIQILPEENNISSIRPKA